MHSPASMNPNGMNGDKNKNGTLTNQPQSATSGDNMPLPNMNSPSTTQQMSPEKMGNNQPEGELQKVIIEIRVPKQQGARAVLNMNPGMNVPGFKLDTNYEPIPVTVTPEQAARLRDVNEETVIVRGTVPKNQIQQLETQPNVVKVYQDTPIAPFNTATLEKEETSIVQPMQGFAACPIGSCDCSPGTAKGTMTDVATYLGVDQIWAAGYKGEGIVVGVVDGGITAEGRPVRPGETSRRIGRVIGGWPTSDWGTTAAAWGEHGNMCSTDVLGMAPQAQIYDIRISGDAISEALAGFQWAINQHRANGTPHVLSNSWGIFQENWDADYARNPNHPFTRKVVEAINEGILVLFAAGNCGDTCPDGRCGADNGPGRSIWGANGHPQVITVGAVNKNEQFVGYSSRGPAALDPQKPDFCSITHFNGYFNSDSGTSAATPIAAGVVALLKQAKPTLTQDEVKNVLKSTAKDIGAPGWDQHSGAGIIRVKAAFDALTPQWHGWENLGGYCMSAPAAASWAVNRLDTFVIGTDSAMYHKWWDGSAWQGWENLGGFCLSAPAAVSWGTNRIDTFVIGGDRAMYHKWWDGSAWQGWENLGGFCKQGVAVSSWAANRLDCFVIGGNNSVWHKWWDGASWSGWEDLGGFCISAPAAVSWGPNRIDLFVIGGDHALWHKWWDGSSWSHWESLGGYCLFSPAAASWSANRLDVFVVGTDNAMYRKSWDGAVWSGWENLSGYCTSGPGAVSWGPNRIDAFVIGTDDAMYHKWWG